MHKLVRKQSNVEESVWSFFLVTERSSIAIPWKILSVHMSKNYRYTIEISFSFHVA